MSAGKSILTSIAVALALSSWDASYADEVPELRALLPSSIREAGVVRVASDYPFPPNEYLDDKDQLTGFEYDLSQEAGALLGIEFKWEKQPFDGILPGLAAGNYDLSWSSMTDTINRQKVVDFVDYAIGQGAILVAKGSDVKGKLDLCGRRVSTQRGTTGEKDIEDLTAECVRRGKASVEPVIFPTATAAQLAIKAGSADASLNDAASAAYIAQTLDSGNAFDVVFYNDLDNPRLPMGVAVPKDKEELRDALQAALQRLMDNGTYKKIMTKYNIDPLSIEKIKINSAKE
jgi:polar amino acid transport system substrate-binding protein